MRAPEQEFVVTISNPHSFKSLCETVSNVLINTHFQLVSEDSFEGIRVDTVDPNTVCMVKAKFACNVWVKEGVPTPCVCLRMKTLITLFRHITAQHMLNLIKYTNSPDLVLRVFNRFDQTSTMEFVINTLEQEQRGARLATIESPYTVEMALGQAKTMCKMGKDIKARAMAFEIFEKDTDTYFRISAKGEDATARYIFQSATAEDELASGKKVFALRQGDHPELTTMDRVYHELFSTDFLNLFLKSMEKQSLHLTLVPQGPLILHYQLGADHSHVRFILAPQEQEAA